MRRFLKYLLVALFLIVLGRFLYSVFEGYKQKIADEERIQTLPDVEYISLNKHKINLHDFDSKIPLVLIYFHPECEHCQYEAKEIWQNASEFENCQLVMITPDDSIARVENFCIIHHLWELENLDVLLDKNNTFKKTFGKAIIPSVYIYGADRKLKKQFLGETKPEAIINIIHNPNRP